MTRGLLSYKNTRSAERDGCLLVDITKVVGTTPLSTKIYFCFRKNQISRKEVIHPQLPLGMPCYDFTPVIDPALTLCRALGIANFHGVTGGEYKTRERIQRTVADMRLLAIPTSCRRVAAYNLNWGRF